MFHEAKNLDLRCQFSAKRKILLENQTFSHHGLSPKESLFFGRIWCKKLTFEVVLKEKFCLKIRHFRSCHGLPPKESLFFRWIWSKKFDFWSGAERKIGMKIHHFSRHGLSLQSWKINLWPLQLKSNKLDLGCSQSRKVNLWTLGFNSNEWCLGIQEW